MKISILINSHNILIFCDNPVEIYLERVSYDNCSAQVDIKYNENISIARTVYLTLIKLLVGQNPKLNQINDLPHNYIVSKASHNFLQNSSLVHIVIHKPFYPDNADD